MSPQAASIDYSCIRSETMRADMHSTACHSLMVDDVGRLIRSSPDCRTSKNSNSIVTAQGVVQEFYRRNLLWLKEVASHYRSGITKQGTATLKMHSILGDIDKRMGNVC